MAQSQLTDDTVPTVAVADCLLRDSSYVDKFHDCTRAYPKCGYGLRFFDWVYEGRREPYNSWGNGSAMPVSSVAFAFDTLACRKRSPLSLNPRITNRPSEAVSLGGDADTLASITGGIAGAFYGVAPQPIAGPAWELLDNRLRDVVSRFCVEFQGKMT